MSETVVLLTGFEPFGGLTTNPSEVAVRRLARRARQAGDARVAFAVLPVERRRAWAALRQHLEQTRPRILCMTGLATGRSAICHEERALNRYSPARGGPPRPIDPEGPAERLATLPAEATLPWLERAGLPVLRSRDAGAYTCNFVLYRALAWSGVPSAPGRSGRSGDPELPGVPGLGLRHVGFVHLPPTDETGIPDGPSVPAERVDEALHRLAEGLARHG